MSERKTKRQCGAYYRKERKLEVKERNELSEALTKFFDSSKKLFVANTLANSTTEIVPVEPLLFY